MFCGCVAFHDLEVLVSTASDRKTKFLHFGFTPYARSAFSCHQQVSIEAPELPTSIVVCPSLKIVHDPLPLSCSQLPFSCNCTSYHHLCFPVITYTATRLYFKSHCCVYIPS